MGLLLYPLFVFTAGVFWALVIATIVTLYLFSVVAIFVLTEIAMLVRSAWRPRYPRRPKMLGGAAVPQSRYSNRR